MVLKILIVHIHKKKLQVEMHLNHCRSCIKIYTTTAETLERRIAEGNVGTSAKNDAVPKEKNTTKDNPIEVQPETEENNGQAQNESSIPQTSTRGEERYCI